MTTTQKNRLRHAFKTGGLLLLALVTLYSDPNSIPIVARGAYGAGIAFFGLFMMKVSGLPSAVIVLVIFFITIFFLRYYYGNGEKNGDEEPTTLFPSDEVES